ncbi:MFS transporter [Plantactinospora sp. S1510]|uniref:MFS transporter n=1 Tax=Plantactinospora alkalitolerans TaxID=2789879 RepID=A0ABS0H0H9_9ACTN|nr:MFS transporter [Plantactinospora alkalitolerans]MBF9131950.1 MFS transporter [Plantactinospora alkalitolerans]
MTTAATPNQSIPEESPSDRPTPDRPVPRLGREFGRLWAASAISNIGDGVTAVAGPLLVASLTDDPALIAGAAFVAQLPWLLFSLPGGALVDRLDRRRLMIAVDLGRAVVLGTLAGLALADVVTVPTVYVAFFLLGIGETTADLAAVSVLPSIVPEQRLEQAYGWLQATFVVGNQFVAKPFGAYLFVVAVASPFGLNAVTFVVAALLLTALRRRPVPTGRPIGDRHAGRSLAGEIVVGLRAMWESAVLRMLAVCLCLMNLVFCAAFAVFVLYCRKRLGLDEIGFGVLLTSSAVGGLLGAWLSPRLRRRFGTPALLRAGLVVELGTHAVLAATHEPWLAGAIMALFGAHTMVWGALVMSLRARLVPDELRGRVNSVYSLLDLGGATIGTLLGGILAAGTGSLTVPFWAAALATTLLLLVFWRRLGATGGFDGVGAAWATSRPAPAS